MHHLPTTVTERYVIKAMAGRVELFIDEPERLWDERSDRER